MKATKKALRSARVSGLLGLSGYLRFDPTNHLRPRDPAGQKSKTKTDRWSTCYTWYSEPTFVRGPVASNLYFCVCRRKRQGPKPQQIETLASLSGYECQTQGDQPRIARIPRMKKRSNSLSSLPIRGIRVIRGPSAGGTQFCCWSLKKSSRTPANRQERGSNRACPASLSSHKLGPLAENQGDQAIRMVRPPSTVNVSPVR